jgi:uncharacterized protein YegP (UPF0339 family)
MKKSKQVKIKPNPLKIEVVKNVHGFYYGHVIHRNGRIMADIAEGYTTKRAIKKAIETLRQHLALAPLFVDGEAPNDDNSVE